jgi:DNA-binding CsgD family transcriptional regulator
MLVVTARRSAVDPSPRQLEIIHLLARGNTPKEIAGLLDVSVWTIKNHLVDARIKTKSRTTHELVARFGTVRPSTS